MIRRGEVWWAEFPLPSGRRPTVVVQSNNFNESRLATVVVVLLSSNLALGDHIGNVRLRRGVAGLRKVSIANVTQVHTIGRSRLLERIGMMPAELMERIDEGIKFVLAL